MARSPERILIVVMRRLGDVLLATALIRSVRRAWPAARLEVLVNAGSAAVLEGNPDIDRLWVEPSEGGIAAKLRLAATLCRRFDLAVSALYNDRPHLWTFIASAHRVGVVPPHGHPGAALKRWLMSASCELDLNRVHAVEQYLRIADVLGIARVDEVVPPRPPAAGAPTAWGGGPGGYAVLHPSPLYRYKAWTVEGWRAVCRHLVARGVDVCLSSGSGTADTAWVQSILEGLPAADRAGVFNLGGKLSFAQLTPLIEGARLFVGTDTSVTHLAAATGTPTLALFGPSHPVAWGPRPATWKGASASPWAMKAPLQREGNVWLIQGEGDCVPCLGEGCDKHRDSASLCLERMRPERVIALVDAALAHPALSASSPAPAGT